MDSGLILICLFLSASLVVGMLTGLAGGSVLLVINLESLLKRLDDIYNDDRRTGAFSLLEDTRVYYAPFFRGIRARDFYLRDRIERAKIPLVMVSATSVLLFLFAYYFGSASWLFYILGVLLGLLCSALIQLLARNGIISIKTRQSFDLFTEEDLELPLKL